MHSLFIAPAASESWFNTQAEALGNNGTALVMCLSRDGQEPATHGWCGVTLSGAKEEAVRALLAKNKWRNIVWHTYTDPAFPEQLLTTINLKLIQPDVPTR